MRWARSRLTPALWAKTLRTVRDELVLEWSIALPSQLASRTSDVCDVTEPTARHAWDGARCGQAEESTKRSVLARPQRFRFRLRLRESRALDLPLAARDGDS